MEVSFTYKITGGEGWAELQASCDRALKVNQRFTGFDVLPPGDGETHGYVIMCTEGHDRSAIVRRMVAPIRAVFTRARIASTRIQLMEQRVLPTKRNLTLAEGRTPPGTFADASLAEMLRDAAAADIADAL